MFSINVIHILYTCIDKHIDINGTIKSNVKLTIPFLKPKNGRILLLYIWDIQCL